MYSHDNLKAEYLTLQKAEESLSSTRKRQNLSFGAITVFRDGYISWNQVRVKMPPELITALERFEEIAEEAVRVRLAITQSKLQAVETLLTEFPND